TSSVYSPCPVTRRASSTRGSGLPISLSMSFLGWHRGSGARPCPRSMPDGFDDVDVAGAAADVAFQSPANAFVIEAAIGLQVMLDRHDHAWCAKAALQAVAFHKRLLHFVELVA